MKKSIYLVIALCMTVFSSCSSDDDSFSGSGQGQTAKIELTLTGSNATRASSSTDPATGVATAEATVSNIVVGIFDGDGNKLVVQEVSGESLSVESGTNAITVPLVKGTMSGCTGVVVGNVPATSVAALQSVTTKSSFLGRTISLEDATASGDNQVATSLPMSGEVKDTENGNVTTFSLTAGGSKTGLQVSLVRMVSRITLVSISANFENTAYPGASFKLQRVFLRDAIDHNNVNTSVTPAEAMPSDAAYIMGDGTWSGTVWSDDANKYLFDAQTEGSEPAIGTTSPIPATLPYYWFYAFANSSSTHPTAFVIQGLFDQDGSGASYSGVPVFYPVIIGKIQTGTTFDTGTGSTTGSIIRNTLYNLTVNIKGKGTSSPTDDIKPVNLSVAVNVSDWNTTIVGQSVDFN